MKPVTFKLQCDVPNGAWPSLVVGMLGDVTDDLPEVDPGLIHLDIEFNILNGDTWQGAEGEELRDMIEDMSDDELDDFISDILADLEDEADEDDDNGDNNNA